VVARIHKPISKLKHVVNLREYYDTLRIQAGLPVRYPVPKALKFLHRPKPKSKPASTKPAQPKAGGAPQPRSCPGVGSLKFTVIGGPSRTEPTDDEFLDLDGPVSKDCIAWWNGADEKPRLVWLAWSHSADPRKAFEAFKTAKAAAARQTAEDARAAERTHQAIVEKARAAKAAAPGAASRIGTNGAGTQH
jgi:hypothetical protein